MAIPADSERRRDRLRAVIHRIPFGRIAFWTVMVTFVGLILASYALPLWFQVRGDKLLVVTSGSMAPEIHEGDAVVVRPVSDPSQLRQGQVVTFWSTTQNALVTHRVVALRSVVRRVPTGTNGQDVDVVDSRGTPIQDPYIETRGDANNGVSDANLTPAALVQGVVREVHPDWGRLLAWSHSSMGRLMLFGPPLLLLVMAELLSRLPSGWWRRMLGDRRHHGSPLTATGSYDSVR